MRPFPRNELAGGEFLSECFNFVPSETGLAPYARAYGLGWSNYFNYLEIKDQLSVSWYWYPVFDGHILVGSTIPSEPTTGLDAVAITAVPTPYWLEIRDENSAIWFLYPDSTTGETRARDAAPAIGTGISNFLWRGTTMERWMLKFNNADKSRYSVRI